MATITVTGTRITNEIPPRCRKPRDVRYDESVKVTLAEASKADMTPAFWVRNGPSRFFNYSTTIHSLDGRLYRPLLLSERYAIREEADEAVIRLGDEMFAFEQRDRNHVRFADNAEDFAVRVRADFDRFIIVDGEVWTVTAEPCWYVTTFGMGGNHGGTALMTSIGVPNARPELIFRADDFESARDAAARIAAGRGDTESVPRLESRRSDLKVLDPDAVTLVTIPAEPDEARDARRKYRIAVSALRDAETVEQEAEAYADVVRTRQTILDLGVPVIEPTLMPYEARTLAFEKENTD